MGTADSIAETEVLLRRFDLLERLSESPAYIRDLVDETDQSRSTINRAITELEDAALIQRGSDGIEATIAGQLALDRLTNFLGDLDDVLTATAVLDPLPHGTTIDPTVVAGGEAILATDPAPYRPLERLFDDLTDATHYRALLPTLDDPRHVRLLYEHVVTDGNTAELVVAPAVYETLRQEFPRHMAAMAETEAFSVLVGPVPPFGLGLLGHSADGWDGDHETDGRHRENDSGPPSSTTAHLVVHNDSGGVHGLLVNRTESAIAWAADRYLAHHREATDRTHSLVADPDGGVRAWGASSGSGTVGQTLPVTLERDGFVGIDVTYFRDEPVADPMTAWRAGFTLTEVHTGYAVPRVRPSAADGGGRADAGITVDDDATTRDDAGITVDDDATTRDDEAANRDDEAASHDDPDDRELAETIAADLTAGRDCLVLGPPGSGKSTILKQVACEWYDADRGSVLYREGDRGHAFTSVDDLVETVSRSSGHVLIVIEDAVRPDANAVFEAIDRLADLDDVSILLDARETEWRDFLEQSAVEPELTVTYVPPLRKVDCERLVEHFERTIESTVDVSPAQLWSAIQDDVSDADDGGPNELLRLVHRLATHADPLGELPTVLEDAVAAVFDELSDDDVALSVCLLANVLNAAGIGVGRGLCYAASDDFDAVDDALDRLDGTVLFSIEDGRFRTVHEEWSTAFLAHLVDARGEKAATRQFGAAASALLALADDPDRCVRIADHLDDPWALAAVIDEPTAWADTTAEAVYAIGLDRPKLGPLFGDGERDSVDLPAACSEAIAEERAVWLGRTFLGGGYFDRAERAFERLSPSDTNTAVERLLGLATISIERGAYDDAVAYCEECLERVEPADRPVVSARALVGLGDVLVRRGEFESADEHYRSALDDARLAANRRWEARVQHKLGEVSQQRGEFEAAREYYESSLDLVREVGDRADEARTLDNLAQVATRIGEPDRAKGLYGRALEIRSELGDRAGMAQTLNNFAQVFWARGDYDRAAELCERSLELKEEIGDRPGMAVTLKNLGEIEVMRDDYEQAHELFERSFGLREEFDDRSGMAETFVHLGEIARRRRDYDQAQENFDRSHDLAAACGNELVVGVSSCALAHIAIAREEFDVAETQLEAALAADGGQGSFVEDRVELLRGRLCLARGDLARARTHASTASDAFESAGNRLWAAWSTRLLGRIAAAAGEDERARTHLFDALETLKALGIRYDALVTIRLLVESVSADEETVDEWRERARALLPDDPDPVLEREVEKIEEFA